MTDEFCDARARRKVRKAHRRVDELEKRHQALALGAFLDIAALAVGVFVVANRTDSLKREISGHRSHVDWRIRGVEERLAVLEPELPARERLDPSERLRNLETAVFDKGEPCTAS